MKLLILYRPNDEFATEVEAYARDFARQYEVGKKAELVSLSTRDGAATATLYDVVAYPAILVLNIDGSVLGMWQGMPLPLMAEVAGYAYGER